MNQKLLKIKNKAELAALSAYIEEIGPNADFKKDLERHKPIKLPYSFHYGEEGIGVCDWPFIKTGRKEFEILPFSRLEEFLEKPLRWNDLKIGETFRWKNLNSATYVKLAERCYADILGDDFLSAESTNTTFSGMEENREVIRLDIKVKIVTA